MSVIDVAFLGAIVSASIKLLQSRPNAPLIYTCIFLALIAWSFGPGLLWTLHNGIGISMAAASGVGSMGTGPLIFFPVLRFSVDLDCARELSLAPTQIY
jgi:hypothetical protein